MQAQTTSPTKTSQNRIRQAARTISIVRRLRAKLDKIFVVNQAAIPSSQKTPFMARRRSW